MWEVVKLSLQPVAGEGWYVSDSPRRMVHCGAGSEGEALANLVCSKLNLSSAAKFTRPDKAAELTEALRKFCTGALSFEPDFEQQYPEGHPLRGAVNAILNLKNEAMEIQRIIMSK
ncbi:hypothetical protein [Ferrovibrio sp.]|uniref:hypothetical protein n=1 Tax=Ferrovibrio sp. TaxID=1917215 RepID=UPI0035B4D479